MANDELEKYLINLERDNCFCVDVVLKENSHEVTERGYFLDPDQGPSVFYIRKRIAKSSGIGLAYQRLFDAQSKGLHFAYLPKITQCFESGDQLVVVMEYLNGNTLDVEIEEKGASLDCAAEVFPRLCDAVGELHRGFNPPLIHRDLKPSNIMVMDNALKIVDFGISRTYKKDADQDTCYFGTKAYAPPEQFGYGQTDERSDIYSLGMLLYFCLIGEHPNQKTRRDEFRSEFIPESLQRIIVKAASFDPRDRYASAGELKEAFLVAYRVFEKKERRRREAERRKNQRDLRSRLVLEKRAGLGIRASFSYYFSSLSPLLKVSFVAGVIWDVCLVLWVVFISYIAWEVCFGPAAKLVVPASAELSFLVNISFAFYFFITPFYLVFDHRPLRCVFPGFPKWSLARDVLIVALIMLCGFIGFVLFYIFLRVLGLV